MTIFYQEISIFSKKLPFVVKSSSDVSVNSRKSFQKNSDEYGFQK